MENSASFVRNSKFGVIEPGSELGVLLVVGYLERNGIIDLTMLSEQRQRDAVLMISSYAKLFLDNAVGSTWAEGMSERGLCELATNVAIDVYKYKRSK